MNTKIQYKEVGGRLDALAHAVIGAAIEVQRLLGPGLLEVAYEEALCVEMRLRDIPFARRVNVPMIYKGHTIGENRLDLRVGGELIVALKAIDGFSPINEAQLLTYLKITGHRLGLLINFNVPMLRQGIKRLVI